MVSGLFLCCLLAVAAAYPARLDNDTVPYQDYGVQDIVNGWDSEYGRFNSILSLKINGSHMCGATLISATRAITAAHCLQNGQSYKVQAGQLNFNQTSGYEVTADVTEFIKHPQFDPSVSFGYDIGILKFSAIPFGRYVHPLKMVTDADGDLTHKMCYIAGWGKTSGSAIGGSSILQYRDVRVMQNSACKNYWTSSILDTNICVEHFGFRVSACSGDSGGPLTCLFPDGEKLAGVTSWGHRQCPGTFPSVYTRVSKYQDWIAQNM